VSCGGVDIISLVLDAAEYPRIGNDKSLAFYRECRGSEVRACRKVFGPRHFRQWRLEGSG
jgi:hypothetical protein